MSQTTVGVCQKAQKPTARALNGQSQNDLRGKINNIAVDYNIKYEINIHDLILIQISNLVNKYVKKNSQDSSEEL